MNSSLLLKSRMPSITSNQLLAVLCAVLLNQGVVQGQITVTRNTTVNQAIADRTSIASTITIANSGIQTIDLVSASLNLSSADSLNPMALGHFTANLSRGISSEPPFTTVNLLSRSTSRATSLNGSYSFNTQFDGPWSSDIWSVVVEDQVKGGGTGYFNGWGLSITGQAADSGVMDPGQGGKISATGAGTQAIGATVSSTGSGANAVALEATAGKTLQLNGGLQGAGEFKAEAGGNVRLNAASSGFSGKLTVNSGQVEVANSSAIGAGSLEVASGAALKVAAGVNLANNVAVTGTNKVALSGGSSSSDVSTISGVISGTGGLEKTGAGTVAIVGTNTFTGATDVAAGKLVVNGDISSSSKTTVASGGTLGGSGKVGALEVASGGTLAVGNSPGQLNAGNTTWSGGASLAWEVDNSTGNETPSGNFLTGAGANWDFLNVTGTLNITATSGNKFIIDVISLLNGTSNSGGFQAGTDYSFAIATASSGILIDGTGIADYIGGAGAFNSALASLFDINTTAFMNNQNNDALWSISTASGGTSLVLSYSGSATAIPEPSSASMLVLGLAALLAQRRRCRR